VTHSQTVSVCLDRLVRLTPCTPTSTSGSQVPQSFYSEARLATFIFALCSWPLSCTSLHSFSPSSKSFPGPCFLLPSLSWFQSSSPCPSSPSPCALPSRISSGQAVFLRLSVPSASLMAFLADTPPDSFCRRGRLSSPL
jgi:hypothetical protein